MWKGARNYRKRSSKKKDDETDEGAETGEGGAATAETTGDEEEDPYAWCSVKLHIPKPKLEDIGPNQMDSFCRPMTYEPGKDGPGDGSGNGDKRGAGADRRQVAPWRYGPAQYWYDKLGVGESEEDFEEQLRRCRQVDKKENEEPDVAVEAEKTSHETAEKENIDALIAAAKDSSAADAAAAAASTTSTGVEAFRYEANAAAAAEDPTSSSISMDVEYPEAAFHLITQLQWEDDIIWNGEEYRTKLYQNRHRQAAAGWVPSR